MKSSKVTSISLALDRNEDDMVWEDRNSRDDSASEIVPGDDSNVNNE